MKVPNLTGSSVPSSLLLTRQALPTEGETGGSGTCSDRENDTIRFVGWVDTRELPAGKYTLLAVLPNYETREVPDLSGDFEVLAQ